MLDVLIEFEGVSFSYGDHVILHDINLRIPKGTLTAIMGGSGSGKTTLLRLIGGQIKPTKGKIRVAGQLTSKLSDSALFELRRHMGMLFQFGALFTDLSTYDNVAFPLRERTDLPESAIRDLVMMKLQAVGLRGSASKKPNELSGGMARRVALARAIALDPTLLLCDEPFTGLDPISLGVTGQLIRRFNDALGATSLIVTHDIAESLAIVDYIYFLADGSIVAQGSPEEIRTSTLPFVKQFVNGEPDGPVPFHQEAAPYSQELGL
jgi:phospholipid/cholesterol/gamma-HCH transport system ATP-binding protein